MRWLQLVMLWLAVSTSFAADRTPAPLSPEQAVKSMLVPEGFQVSLVVAEPDIVQPVSFCFDDRGRIVAAEALNYGEWQETGKDRIVILEDKDGDGRAETRKVFYEGLNYVTGIEVGFGGVWVMSVPKLYFIPDHNGDDVADGPPEVLFDGFGYRESRHNLANGFTWGPDGWLYFGHGRTTPSDVGRPGTPKEERVHCDGGVCRIHPTRLVFENFADGTTNPWGVDFDDYGQCFVSNCVNPHLFHVIQGAHYEPWRNRPSSLYAYERIATIADHLHYPSDQPKAMRGETQETLAMGGGHAHCGTLIYLGGAFPERYRNSVFMCNVHGRRINNDILKRTGSGYVASHGPDFMISGDPWFMGVTLKTGPDGAVYVSDWSDTGECHTYKPDRGSGRIYRISYVGTATNKNGTNDRNGGKSIHPINAVPSEVAAAAKLPLSDRSDAELVQLQLHPNDWYVRHARRLLQERSENRAFDRVSVTRSLSDMASPKSGLSTDRRLRALWTLYATYGVPSDELKSRYLRDSDEWVRAWSVRLLMQPLGDAPMRDGNGSPDSKTPRFVNPPTAHGARFARLAKSETSPIVMLALIESLQRFFAGAELARHWVAKPLVERSDVIKQPHAVLMLWYGIEPIVEFNSDLFIKLISAARIPKIREFGARRFVDHVLAKKGEKSYGPLVSVLVDADDEAARDMLTGIREALRGRKRIDMPSNWPATYMKLKSSSDPEIRELTAALAVIFGDKSAIADLLATAANRAAPTKERNTAIELLRDQAPPQLPSVLQSLLDDKDVRRAAIRGLAVAQDKDTPSMLVASYATFSTEEKQDAVATLTSRKEYADALLDALEKKSIPRADVSAYAARQLHAFGDKMLTERLRTIWGDIRDSAPDKQQLIAKYKTQLTPNTLKNADLSNGRLLFKKTCQQCHKLFGEGNSIGPDLTGSNRANIDYILGNILDPSAEISRDFRMSIVTTTAGRVLTGLQVETTPARVTLQTATERVVLDRSDIDEINESPLSMMPEGQLNPLTKEEVRDLIGYLGSSKQVPLP